MMRQADGTALLIVDVQVGVMADAWEASRVINRIELAIQRAREANVPIVWIQHEDDELVRDSPPWQLVSQLEPQPADLRIYKRFNSAFEATTLQEDLRALGAKHLVLAGAATNWCIRATAYGALDRDYDLTLLEDAHTTSSMELSDGVRIEAASVIAELNVAMRWLSYPGRKNSIATAAAVDFGQRER